jgi:hypothetical protein
MELDHNQVLINLQFLQLMEVTLFLEQLQPLEGEKEEAPIMDTHQTMHMGLMGDQVEEPEGIQPEVLDQEVHQLQAKDIEEEHQVVDHIIQLVVVELALLELMDLIHLMEVMEYRSQK